MPRYASPLDLATALSWRELSEACVPRRELVDVAPPDGDPDRVVGLVRAEIENPGSGSPATISAVSRLDRACSDASAVVRSYLQQRYPRFVGPDPLPPTAVSTADENPREVVVSWAVSQDDDPADVPDGDWHDLTLPVHDDAWFALFGRQVRFIMPEVAAPQGVRGAYHHVAWSADLGELVDFRSDRSASPGYVQRAFQRAGAGRRGRSSSRPLVYAAFSAATWTLTWPHGSGAAYVGDAGEPRKVDVVWSVSETISEPAQVPTNEWMRESLDVVANRFDGLYGRQVRFKMPQRTASASAYGHIGWAQSLGDAAAMRSELARTDMLDAMPATYLDFLGQAWLVRSSLRRQSAWLWNDLFWQITWPHGTRDSATAPARPQNLSGDPTAVTVRTVDIAAARLCPTEDRVRRSDEALRWLESVAAGRVELTDLDIAGGGGDGDDHGGGPEVLYDGPDRVFTRDSLSGFIGR